MIYSLPSTPLEPGIDEIDFSSGTIHLIQKKTGIIRHLVNESIDRAGIEVGSRKHGTHAFRSSLASHMISDNNSYDVVRKILGHSDPNVIKHYAKTAIMCHITAETKWSI